MNRALTSWLTPSLASLTEFSSIMAGLCAHLRVSLREARDGTIHTRERLVGGGEGSQSHLGQEHSWRMRLGQSCTGREAWRMRRPTGLGERAGQQDKALSKFSLYRDMTSPQVWASPAPCEVTQVPTCSDPQHPLELPTRSQGWVIFLTSLYISKSCIPVSLSLFSFSFCTFI